MPLARNKQIALCVLLATRSALRGQIEGTPVNPGDPVNPPQSGADITNRMKANLPQGITSADIDQVFLGNLFVPPSSTGGPPASDQVNNVATDIGTIMTALTIQYDPSIPKCPSATEINPLTQAILAAIPA